MARLVRLCVLVTAGLSLAGCLSGEPKVAEAEQVSAEQRAALEATEGAAGDGGAPTAEFVAIDIAYEQAPSELPSGPVVATLQNDGQIEHNVVIAELDDRKILDAAAGESDRADVEFDPGTYTYYCDVPGHRAAGMEGTLTVTG